MEVGSSTWVPNSPVFLLHAFLKSRCGGGSVHLSCLPAVFLAVKFPHAAVFVFSRLAGCVAMLSRGSIDQLITLKTSLLTRKS